MPEGFLEKCVCERDLCVCVGSSVRGRGEEKVKSEKKLETPV